MPTMTSVRTEDSSRQVPAPRDHAEEAALRDSLTVKDLTDEVEMRLVEGRARQEAERLLLRERLGAYNRCNELRRRLYKDV